MPLAPRGPVAAQPVIPRLTRARVHEAVGPGAAFFALVAAAGLEGPVVWISPDHAPEALMPQAVARFIDPARLLLVRAGGEVDLLWSTEEALRSGAAGLVVAEPQKPMSLTAGRRLQLAAEAGRTLGLMLIREGEGSNVAETRWQADPVLDAGGRADSTRQRWRLIKNKSGTFGDWCVDWDDAARSLCVVSEAGK